MKRWRASVVAVLAIATVTHFCAVWALPRVIMRVVLSRGADRAGKNQLTHPPMPTAADREIVRPSPDFAYSVCVLDLSQGPVRVEVPLTPPYTSVALYSGATDNYFVQNDRASGGRPLDLVVVAPGEPPPARVPAESQVVEAPDATGLVLVRRVVESPEAFPALDAARRRARCAPFEGAP